MLTGIIVGGVIAWWLIKRPPKIVKWILNNKIKSLAILAAAYLGFGAVQKTISHANHRDKVKQEVKTIQNEVRARQKAEQTNKIKKQNPRQTQREAAVKKKYDEAFKKATEKRMAEIEARKKNPAKTPETSAIEQKAFVSTPDKDMSARAGSRAMVAHERMQHFINTRAKQSERPDLSGMHTLLIYQEQNPTNHVVLHVGFHATSQESNKPYRVYESMVKTEKGTMPMIGSFNIQFTDAPEINLGVSANENGVKLVNLVPNMATLNIDKNKGRTALRVGSDGTLGFLTDPKEIEAAFSHVNLEQVAPLTSHEFAPYNVKGKYKYPQTRIASPIHTSEGR